MAASPAPRQPARSSGEITLVAGLDRRARLIEMARVYAEYLGSRSAGGPPPKALWIAPHARAAEGVPRLLQRQGVDACLDPGVTTLRRLAEAVVSSHLSTPLLLPGAASRWLLRRALQRVSSLGKLSLLDPSLDRPGLVDALEDSIEEWKGSGLSPNDVLEQAERLVGRRREREFALVYQEYQRLLVERGAADRFDLRAIAAREWKSGTGTTPCYELLVVESLDTLTPTDATLLKAIVGSSHSVYVGAIWESPSVERSERSELFVESQRQLAWLKSHGRPLRIEHVAPAGPARPEFDRLRERLFLPPTSDADAERPPQAVIVRPAVDSSQELAAAARQIKHWIVAEKICPSEIVLAAPSLGSNQSRIAEVLRSYGVPHWIDASTPVGEAPPIVALESLLAMHLADWPYRGVLEVVACRLLRAFDAPTHGGRWPSERATTEWLLRELQVARGRTVLRDQMARLAEADTRESPTLSARREAAQVAQRAIGLLDDALQELPEAATPAEWMEELTQLAEKIGLVLEPSSPSAWSRLREGALWIERAAADEPLSWSLQDCLDYLRDAGRSISAPPQGSREARVAVLSLSAARYTHPRHMVVVGLGEKALTTSAAPGRALGDDLVHLTPNVEAPADPAADYTRSMRLFFELVGAPAKALTLSYPALDNRGQLMPPSPLLLEACHALGTAWVDMLTQPPAVGRLIDEGSTPHSPKEWRQRAVADLALAQPTYTPLASLLATTPTRPTAQMLQGALRSIHARSSGQGFGPWEGVLASPDIQRRLTKKYGPEHIWSASQIETYADCPYKFYLRHVLGIEAQEDLVLATDHRRQGSLAHDALKVLHERLRSHNSGAMPLSALAEELFDELYEQGVQEAAKNYAQHGIEGVLVELMAAEVRKWRTHYREQHAQYDRSCCDWEAPLLPAHLELRFGPANRASDTAEDPHSTDEPFALEVQGGAILFAGRIDRIDVGRVAGQMVFQIIDYKTSTRLRLSEAELKDARKLQPSLYAMAAATVVGEPATPALPMASGYWGLRAKGYHKSSRLEMHRLEQGQLVESPTWAEIRQQVAQRVEQLVTSIRRGEFPVFPADDDSCRRCEYRQGCRVQLVRSLDKQWEPAPVVTSGEPPLPSPT